MRTLFHFPALFALIITFLFSCRTFTPVEQPGETLFTNEVADYLSGYDVYMHGTGGVFKLENARVSGDTIYGKAVEVSPADSAALAAKAVRDKKHQVDIYTDSDIQPGETTAKVRKKDIRKVTMYGVDQRKSFEDSMSLALIVVLGIVLVALLIGLIVALANAGTNAAGNSSDTSSDGSNSGSGGSDSGSGTSGGSNSGCYIATMVYGSYDAPEVMTLRKFRDETLSRSAPGRTFIRWYYGWSPGFVKRYNHLGWLHRCIRFALNGFVKLLAR